MALLPAVDWWNWGGAAAAAVAADYADVKLRPLSSRLTNSELIALGAILVSAFGSGYVRNPRYMDAINGGATWGIGMLASGLARRHLVPPVVQTTPPPKMPTTPAYNPGLAGVAATAGSEALVPSSGAY